VLVVVPSGILVVGVTSVGEVSVPVKPVTKVVVVVSVDVTSDVGNTDVVVSVGTNSPVGPELSTCIGVVSVVVKVVVSDVVNEGVVSVGHEVDVVVKVVELVQVVVVKEPSTLLEDFENFPGD